MVLLLSVMLLSVMLLMKIVLFCDESADADCAEDDVKQRVTVLVQVGTKGNKAGVEEDAYRLPTGTDGNTPPTTSRHSLHHPLLSSLSFLAFMAILLRYFYRVFLLTVPP